MSRLMTDLAVDRAADPDFARQDKWDPAAADEDEEDEDDGGEENIVDRCEWSFRCEYGSRADCEGGVHSGGEVAGRVY